MVVPALFELMLTEKAKNDGGFFKPQEEASEGTIMCLWLVTTGQILEFGGELMAGSTTTQRHLYTQAVTLNWSMRDEIELKAQLPSELGVS